MDLKGKVCLITGGAQGIGKSFAETLLGHGAKVVLLDINESEGDACKKFLDKRFDANSSLFIQCDVGSEEQLTCAFKRTTDHFGRLDIMCNNAGINNENNWETTMNINLISVIRGTYLALDYMNKTKGGLGGVIVNTASLAGIYPIPSGPVYTATKHGVIGFTRAIAETSRIAGYGVRINTICPGFVDTPILDSVNHEDQMGTYYRFKDSIKAIMKHYGLIQPSVISQGLMRILEEEDMNGAVMKITVSRGIHFEKYENELFRPEGM